MATRVGVLDGGGPMDSENTLNTFLTKCGENVFWQITPDMLPEKLIFLHFFPIFLSNGPVHLWKLINAPKYLAGATNSTIFYHLEQFLAMKMAISNSENWLKNKKIKIFSTFFYIFVSNGLVHLWKWISASKYLAGASSGTILDTKM